MCGTPSLNYLSLVVPPEILREAAHIFDGWTRETFTIKHDLAKENLPTWVWDQLSLPMNSGGMSLRQYTVMGRLTFWSAFAGASKFLVERGIANSLSEDGWMSQHIQDSWSWLAGELPDAMSGPGKPLLPKNGKIRHVLTYYATQNVQNESENVDVSRHLQKNLFKLQNKNILSRLQNKLPPLLLS